MAWTQEALTLAAILVLTTTTKKGKVKPNTDEKRQATGTRAVLSACLHERHFLPLPRSNAGRLTGVAAQTKHKKGREGGGEGPARAPTQE